VGRSGTDLTFGKALGVLGSQEAVIGLRPSAFEFPGILAFQPLIGTYCTSDFGSIHLPAFLTAIHIL
jgi:hypothetical protein